MVRRTAQRDAIRRVFQEAGRPLAPPEIMKLAKAFVPRLGLTTVYRAVNALVAAEWLAPVQIPGEPARYEVVGQATHDYFRCRVCHKVYAVPECRPRPEGLPAGFVVEGHHLVLEGRCRACAHARVLAVPRRPRAHEREGEQETS